MTDAPAINLTTTHVLTCPFCNTEVHIVRDEDDTPGVIHEQPTCTEFDESGDALDFVTLVRKEYERREGIS